MEKGTKVDPYLIFGQQYDNYYQRNNSPRIGAVKTIDDEGCVFVDFPGNPFEQLIAALAISKSDMVALHNAGSDARVLILFEDNDLRRPVISGLVYEVIDSQVEYETTLAEPAHKLLLDGNKQVIEAEEEMILCCGKSSITLKKNGKIILRGTDLVSRSSGGNKIRGATVKIN